MPVPPDDDILSDGPDPTDPFATPEHTPLPYIPPEGGDPEATVIRLPGTPPQIPQTPPGEGSDQTVIHVPNTPRG
jgi:hypothetical protein